MAYVACTVVSGSAHVADTDELSDIAWATPAQFDDYVPTASPPWSRTTSPPPSPEG